MAGSEVTGNEDISVNRKNELLSTIYNIWLEKISKELAGREKITDGGKKSNFAPLPLIPKSEY